MAKETVGYLAHSTDGLYLDCTFGAGGHTKQLLSVISPNARVIGLDLDQRAVEIGKELEKEDNRFSIIHMNFADYVKYRKEHDLPKAKGVIFDLGASTMQLKDKERGFSYKYDAHLDMRMDQSSSLTAAEILNTYPRRELKDIFKKYGDIANPDKLVNLISLYRKQNDFIETTEVFKAIVEEAFWNIDAIKFNKVLRKCFQALRIAVNKEFSSLEKALESLNEILEVGGIACIITFHSGEERIVRAWKSKYCDNIEIQDYSQNILNKFKFVTEKYIVPEEYEIVENWASRSSKLWVIQKVKD
ncbi:16S rRNA (cytosine(1402)-N(4))-methyltransferase [Candidatus Mycoplasma haematobovis]|uniref:Ribosomal RNA small subunit methyltransferase H n=2 Tax=Candidatus Mycoplasma haematobovis TaxID=432608 RepID=A0A1A9QC68_9MOLU|nr:16S rRNA (cytosine(1402)-N(4))-methyltransferase [Candidatus Mycoplasma haematobovis]